MPPPVEHKRGDRQLYAVAPQDVFPAQMRDDLSDLLGRFSTTVDEGAGDEVIGDLKSFLERFGLSGWQPHAELRWETIDARINLAPLSRDARRLYPLLRWPDWEKVARAIARVRRYRTPNRDELARAAQRARDLRMRLAGDGGLAQARVGPSAHPAAARDAPVPDWASVERFVDLRCVSPPEADSVGYLYWYERAPGQHHAVLYHRKGLDGPPRIVVDPSWFGSNVRIRNHAVSPGGRYLTINLSGGSGSQLEVFDLRVRQLRPVDSIPGVGHAEVQWLGDDSGFFYVRPPPGAGGDAQRELVFRHDLRTSFTEDKVVFGEDRSAEAHYELAMSDDGRSLVITGSVDGGGSDVHLYRIDTGEFTAVAEGLRSRFRTVVVRGNMFLWTDHGAQRGRVLRAPLDSLPGRVDDWPELVPERAYPLREVYFGRNAMVAHYLEDLQSRAELLDYDTGRTVGVLDLPKLSTLDGVRANPRSADFFYGVTTLLGPTTIYRYDAGRAESTRYDSFVDRQLGQPQRGTSGRERQAGGLAGALTAVPDRIAWVRVVLPGLARGAVAYAVAVEAFIRLIDQPNGPYGRLLHRAMWLLDDGADLLEVIDEGLDDLDAARLQVAADRLGQVLARLYQTVPATNPDVAGLTSQQSSPVGPTVGDISFPASRLHTTKIFPHQVSALMLASSPRKPFEYNDPNRSVYVPMADAARAYYRPDVVRALNHVAIEVGITDLHFQIEHQLLSELDPAEVVEMHTGIGYTYQSVRIRAALMSVLGPRLATLKGIPPRRTP